MRLDCVVITHGIDHTAIHAQSSRGGQCLWRASVNNYIGDFVDARHPLNDRRRPIRLDNCCTGILQRLSRNYFILEHFSYALGERGPCQNGIDGYAGSGETLGETPRERKLAVLVTV